MKVLVVGGCGYIGCRLTDALEGWGIDFDVCDPAPAPWQSPRFPVRYQELAASDLRGYTSVLWFGGHSSVRQAIADPDGCIRNNCLDLYDFARRLGPEVRLLYASSASLYSREAASARGEVPVSSEGDVILPNANEYDTSKFAFDYIARTFLSNFVGLRMGTVCGHSRRLRGDLIFNAMNLSAIESGRVGVSNPEAYRSLLFLDDLVALVRVLLCDKRGFTGFLNAASLSATVGQIGSDIAMHYDAEIVERGSSATYSFRLDTTMMDDLMDHTPKASLSEQCAQFRRALSHPASVT